ncbi:MAG: leucyl aminopeptidase, partial [Dehalococcoidia bacterium]
MRVLVEAGDIAQFEADAIVVNLFEGVTAPGGATGAVDAALDGAIRQLISLGDIRGKSGEITVIHTLGRLPAPRVVVVGLGKTAAFDIDSIRNLSASLVRHLRKTGTRRVATIVHGAGIAGLPPAECTRAVAEGAVLGSYRFLKHQKPAEDRRDVEELVVVEHAADRIPDYVEAVRHGVILAEATNMQRDLANEPANHLTPTDLAGHSARVASEVGLEVEVLERRDMEAAGMGCLLSVAAGSAQPPKLIALSYRGRGGDGYDLALVGKGITFDTGGISIKPAASMPPMKADMTGAASVIAAIGGIARLGPELDVLALAPCTENMPGGNATRPGDVVKAMNGVTVEILNTDAEGRLVLADALCLARERGARAVIDVATLTGAATAAFADICYGVMTNNEDLATRVERGATAAGEKTWRLPMFKEYDEYVKSDVADIKNTGAKGGGTIMGAKFLERFVADTPWVHLD